MFIIRKNLPKRAQDIGPPSVSRDDLIGEAISTADVAHGAKGPQIIFTRLSTLGPRNEVIHVKNAFGIAQGDRRTERI